MAGFGGRHEADARDDVIGRGAELEAVRRFVERARDSLASLLVIGVAAAQLIVGRLP